MPAASSNRPALATLPRQLRREELPIDTEALARYLIGKTLIRETKQGTMIGRIVETEAYALGDAASHGFRGETKRNRSLFLERGHAYVYFIYGMHYALNVSAGRVGDGTGVLIRAMEPIAGMAVMQKNRGVQNELDLARGPGRLAEALHITQREDGLDLCAAVTPAGSRRFSRKSSRSSHSLWLAAALRRTAPIIATIRIGITKEIHRPLRFYEQGNPYVSGPKRLNSNH